MASKVISFRVQEDLFQTFERMCSEKGVGPAEMLRQVVDDLCFPPKADDVVDKKDSEATSSSTIAEAQPLDEAPHLVVIEPQPDEPEDNAQDEPQDEPKALREQCQQLDETLTGALDRLDALEARVDAYEAAGKTGDAETVEEPASDGQEAVSEPLGLTDILGPLMNPRQGQ